MYMDDPWGKAEDFAVDDRVVLAGNFITDDAKRLGKVVQVGERGLYVLMDWCGQLAWVDFRAQDIQVTKVTTSEKTLLCRVCQRDIDMGRPCWWCGDRQEGN